MKTCTKCHLAQEESEFHKAKNGKNGLLSWCKTCAAIMHRASYLRNKSKAIARAKAYNAKHPEKCAAWTRARTKRLWAQLRESFLALYGQKCSCCGDPRRMFLTLDHVNPMKNKRDQVKEYNHALSVYRPDLYQVLCFNCNCLKRMGLRCPCGTKYGGNASE